MEAKSSNNSRICKVFSAGCIFGGLLLLVFLIDKSQENALIQHKPVIEILADTSNVNSMGKPIFNLSGSIQQQRQECNMFNGRWVYMPKEDPIYNARQCPFLDKGVICQNNGRPDFQYQKWRWEAYDCDIPLFDARDMLGRLRNKRMIIVGDSINRNMWESLACLLYSSVSSNEAQVVAGDSYKVFKAKDYNFSIEFYWSPFLVELNQKHQSGRKVLVLDKLSPNSMEWKGADIMVFNAAHWWTHQKPIQSWDLFEYKGNLSEDMPRNVAYELGLRTWASWINKNADPKKTSVFFRSISPIHTARKYDQWCYNVTQPYINVSNFYVSGLYKTLMDVSENFMKEISQVKVKYLNITKLSQFRIDAHPSIYVRDLKTRSKNNLGDNAADCSHWCLPGLPDTWNRLLYASILFDIQTDVPAP